MMRVLLLRVITRLSVVLVAVGLAVPLSAQKSGQSAGEFYLSYLAAAEKMKSLKELVPFMPKDQAAMFAKIPKTSRRTSSSRRARKRSRGRTFSKRRPTRRATCSRSRGRGRRPRRRSKGGRASSAKTELSSSPRTIGPATPHRLLRRSPQV
jgi:hypothetical protein